MVSGNCSLPGRGRKRKGAPSALTSRIADGFIRRRHYYLGNRPVTGEEQRMADVRKVFEIKAQWDGEAAVWWCSNDELPLTTEAATFEQLVSRVLEIAPEIAAENGLAAPGDEIELRFVGERVQSVPVVAAA
jgi:Domain of unknown function (DUF1902)